MARRVPHTTRVVRRFYAVASSGRRSAQGRAVSSCAASASSVPSSAGRPASSTEVGSPSSPWNSGTEMAGCPVTLKMAVAALVGEDLLRPQGEPGGLLGRQGEGLVTGVRVQALGAAEHRRQRLDRRPDDVVVDRLGGQRRAGRLDVEPARHRPRVRRAEPVPHDPGPHPARRPELRDLLEQLRPGSEEEATGAARSRRSQPAGDGRLE